MLFLPALLSSVALAAKDPVLELTGLSFVASRAGTSELLLEADRVRFETATETAELADVRVVFTDPEGASSFEMTCDRGRLDLQSSDFVAEGNVRGRTADGVHIATSRAQYDHRRGLVSGSAPVEIEQQGTLLRGDGFEYDAEKRRLRLVGAAEVVQSP